jgi:hypothetical protein
MRKKLIAAGTIGLITIALIGAIVIKTHQSKRPAKLTAVKAEAKPSEAPADAKPDTTDHLVIDKIGTNARIVSVGLTKEGNMDAPGNIYDVGLYKYGAKLGQNGTAVLAGHLDGANGEKGVFYDLNKLKAGDTITINRYNATPLTYKVTKTKIYKSTDKPTEVFKSSSGAHLNLITCTGSWDKNKAQYDERLVVFTELVK